MIGVDLVCHNIPEADSVQDLNPGADTADTSEPVPGVDSPSSLAQARDKLPIDHVSPSAGVRGQYVSPAVHVLPTSPGVDLLCPSLLVILLQIWHQACLVHRCL
jgi:hypothetical protein